MQFSDMKALKSLYTHKTLFLLNPAKSPNSLSFLTRQFHCTSCRFRSEEAGNAVLSVNAGLETSESGSSDGGRLNGRAVWSIYSPQLGRTVTRRSAKEGDGHENEPGFSNLKREVEDLEGNLIRRDGAEPGLSSFLKENESLEAQRTYGTAKMGTLSGEDKPHLNSLKENEDLEAQRTYGSAKMGTLSGGGKTHLNSLSEKSYDHRMGKEYKGYGRKTQMGISSSDSENEDSLKENSYGRLKSKSLGDSNKIRMGLSMYGNENEDLSNQNRNGAVKKVDSVHGLRSVHNAMHRRKKKSKITWVCENCGYSDGQWWGACRECQRVGTMKQFVEGDISSGGKVSGMEFTENAVQSWLPQQSGDLHPLRLKQVNRGTNQLNWRIPLSGLFGSEVARVLGGGLVPGSLVLIGGDPGVGKSTLVLQIAAMIAEGRDTGEPAPVVYVSGEESVEQIGNRADRMEIATDNLFLYSSTDIEDIFRKIQPLSPCALVVDSIQTVYLSGVAGSAGGLSQVKECTSALLRFAKKTNIPVLLIGHVTKSGDIAGPRLLEHIVDVVLYMEGEKYSSHRLLRPVKNRFGSTDELGVFQMSELGLQAVSNPSEMFLSEHHSNSEFVVGLAVAVIMDGSRSFLIEIQALCAPGSSVSRHVNGIQESRADMIISVLKKQAGLMLQENAIFLNVVSGLKLTETAGDLAIAAAICSSFLEFPIPNFVAFIGELGLAGELRTVPRMDKRVNTVAKLGYKMCVVPESAEKSLANYGSEGMKIIGCKNLKEVINTVFTA